MLKQTSSVLKISALALVLSFGLSYALAWTSPSSNPPSGNVDTPINVGGDAQIKGGDFTAARLFSTASSSIGTTAQTQTLTVAGTIGATGDICTAAGGGKCLSTPPGAIDPAPIGSIVSYAGATAPSGYLICDGAAVSRTTYAALFAAVGTTYGAGDGSTTFNLPDLRGEFVRGLDRGRGVDAGRTLGSWQADMFKNHTHTFAPGPNGQQVEFGYYVGGADGSLDGSRVVTGYDRTSYPANSVAQTTTGGAETRPRNVAMNYIIKAVNNSEMVLMATSSLSNLVPAGAVMHFNLATCPTGWLPANGTSGTPDLRGEFIRGLDNGRGVDAGRALGSAQAQDIQSHTHTTVQMIGDNSIDGVDSVTTYSGEHHNEARNTGATGGSETRPRNVALLACVKS